MPTKPPPLGGAKSPSLHSSLSFGLVFAQCCHLVPLLGPQEVPPFSEYMPDCSCFSTPSSPSTMPTKPPPLGGAKSQPRPYFSSSGLVFAQCCHLVPGLGPQVVPPFSEYMPDCSCSRTPSFPSTMPTKPAPPWSCRIAT